MEDGSRHQHHHQQHCLPGPRRRGAGVDGGGQGAHIVRPAAGRKDRHSKVCTARGLRDRRVRLSAHTAIQFYDVQDRLGFDRPSKAVDWLLKNAKPAIDELSASAAAAAAITAIPDADGVDLPHPPAAAAAAAPPTAPSSDDLAIGEINGHNCFLHHSLDADAIADTIKAFFPIGLAQAPPPPSSSGPNIYQNYPPDLLSRTNSQTHDQNLHLSLHSLNEQNFSVFGGGGGGGGGDYIFDFAHRDSLQSSDSPSIRAWFGPVAAHDPPAHDDRRRGLAGFRVPARIHGDGERGGFLEKLSSDSHQ